MAPSSKAAIYWLLVVFGSFIHDFIPLPQSYFSNKRNVFNVYFVKFSWGWTLSLLIVFVGLTSSIYTSCNLVLMAKHYGRLLVATFSWYFWVNLFLYIEDLTGVCEGDEKFTTRRSCKTQGFHWNGFDISGHAFLLIHCCLVIGEEIQLMKHWEKFITGTNKASGRQEHAMLTPFVRLAFLCIVILQLLWEFMLVCTAVYFHSVYQKVLGAAVAIFTWRVTYRCWYHTDLSPGLPWGNKDSDWLTASTEYLFKFKKLFLIIFKVLINSSYYSWACSSVIFVWKRGIWVIILKRTCFWIILSMMRHYTAYGCSNQSNKVGWENLSWHKHRSKHRFCYMVRAGTTEHLNMLFFGKICNWRYVSLYYLLEFTTMTQMPHFHALSHANRWTTGSTLITAIVGTKMNIYTALTCWKTKESFTTRPLCHLSLTCWKFTTLKEVLCTSHLKPNFEPSENLKIRLQKSESECSPQLPGKQLLVNMRWLSPLSPSHAQGGVGGGFQMTGALRLNKWAPSPWKIYPGF